MTQAYSNPARESGPYALPDIETIHVRRADVEAQDSPFPAPGWYWWSCFPGCLPDGDPVGPFASEAEALADAREGIEDEL